MQNTGFITTQQTTVPVNSGVFAPSPVLSTTAINPQQLPVPQIQYSQVPTFIRYYVPVHTAGGTLANPPKVINIPQGASSYMPISAYNLYIQSINSNSVPKQVPIATKPASITVQNQLPVQPQQPLQTQTQAQTQSQSLSALPTAPLDEQESSPVKPVKSITPLTAELINSLNTSLTKGSKDDRLKAVGQTLKLLREDPDTRKNNPALIGLINKALNSVQPAEVKTAALIACEGGLVANNAKTQQLVQALSSTQDRLENSTLASSALNTLQSSV